MNNSVHLSDTAGLARSAHFRFGQRSADESPDIAFQRSRIQQDMVDAAQLLIEGLR